MVNRRLFAANQSVHIASLAAVRLSVNISVTHLWSLGNGKEPHATGASQIPIPVEHIRDP